MGRLSCAGQPGHRAEPPRNGSPHINQRKELALNHGLKTILYPVKDLAQAKSLYGRLLGVEPDMDEPYYVGFHVGGQDVGGHPKGHPNGHSKGMTGPVGYWHVDDIEQSLRLLLDAGAQSQQAVTDVGGGKLIASVTDADGNVIGLLQQPA